MIEVSDPERAANPRLARAIERLDRSRKAVLDVLAAHSEEQVGRRPGTGRWSALEVFDHIQLVERTISTLLQAPPPERPETLNAALRSRGVRLLPVPWRLWLLARRIGRTDAPAMVRPRELLSRRSVHEAAEQSRATLTRLLEVTPERRLTSVHRTHAILGEFDGIEWIEFLAAHEQRHLLQIREALR